jgi:peroxiredoxin
VRAGSAGEAGAAEGASRRFRRFEDAGMGNSKWMAVTSLVIGAYATVCAVLIFFTKTSLLLPLVLVGIILGAWHLFRSSRLRKLAWLGVLLCVGGTVLFGYGREARTKQIQASMSKWNGYASPRLVLTTLDGAVMDSNGFKGKRVLLNFWATWCGPCIEEVKDISAFSSATSRDDIIVVGISDEDRAVLEPFMKQHGVNYPIVSIPREQLPMPYGGSKMLPVSFILDRNGTIQFVEHGAMTAERLVSLVKDSEDFAGIPKPIPAAAAATKPAATPPTGG